MALALPAGSQLTIRTRVLPPIVIPVGQGGSSSGAAGAALTALQPAVTVTIAGQDLYTFAPAGDPGTSPGAWPLVLIFGAAAVIGLALFGLWKLVR